MLPEAIRPRDLAESYATQAALHQRLAATRIGSRIGYKIGCTTKVMQDYLGLSHPCRAGLFAGVMHRTASRSASTVSSGSGSSARSRSASAAIFRRAPLPSRARASSRRSAAYMAAIEIVDDRYVDWRKTDAATLIADDYFAAGAVLGPPVAGAGLADAAALVGTTEINGREVGRGQGSDVMGHPLNALAWLANSLAEAGAYLRAGEIVLTGSLVETKWLTRGDKASITVADLGTVTLSVV